MEVLEYKILKMEELWDSHIPPLIQEIENAKNLRKFQFPIPVSSGNLAALESLRSEENSCIFIFSSLFVSTT